MYYIINGETLKSIADAIRAKTNFEGDIAVEDMDDVILSIRVAEDNDYKVILEGGFKELIIKSNVEQIRPYCFDYCDTLSSVTMPRVTKIGESAFAYCDSLERVDMPSVTKIGVNAFSRCISLRDITMPSVQDIGGQAFQRCKSVVSVYMPAVESIGYTAFDNCTNLESVYMPSITSIGQGAFADCDSLREVELGEEVPYISGKVFPSTIASILVPESAYFKYLENPAFEVYKDKITVKK